jgi:seryl-tRNA synthetase
MPEPPYPITRELYNAWLAWAYEKFPNNHPDAKINAENILRKMQSGEIPTKMPEKTIDDQPQTPLQPITTTPVESSTQPFDLNQSLPTSDDITYSPDGLWWWDGTSWQPNNKRGTSSFIPFGLLDNPPLKSHFFSSNKALVAENQQLRQLFFNLNIDKREHLIRELIQLVVHAKSAHEQFDQLSRDLLDLREAVMLQQVGIYEYRHPLEDSVEYKARLVSLRAQIKDSIKAGQAVVGSVNFSLNGSTREGTKMVKEFSKLMLRAYNSEAEAAVISMKPYTLESSTIKLNKSKEIISKLGATMQIQITDKYHKLRLHELELTSDFINKVAEEKERDREHREKLREEAIALREYAKEQERLNKEKLHYETHLANLQTQENIDSSEIANTTAKLEEISDSIEGIQRRSANTKAGYVYIISNIGAFGERMVKVGLTRRLEPQDRIDELGNASVPFRYDVHALVFSDDAVGLETHLHHELSNLRVNLVNSRKEFFFATPNDVRDIFQRLEIPLLTFIEEPVAREWHQSEFARHNLLEDTP